VVAATPLTLKLTAPVGGGVKSVRLHYRPVNQMTKFKTMVSSDGPYTFTIPAEDVSAKWDLMYYFEVLNAGGSGWFQPDPQVTTPYYVVKVKPGQ
jgi:hypothetical protein